MIGVRSVLKLHVSADEGGRERGAFFTLSYRLLAGTLLSLSFVSVMLNHHLEVSVSV